MSNNVKNSFNGYIEGYYGKILEWNDRKRIIRKLNKTKFSYYFYAPKNDNYHRKNWRKNYTKKWLKNFKSFCLYAKQNNVSVIAGISPGIDLNFCEKKVEEEKSLLIKKIQLLQDYGANKIAILFDDIPKNKSLQELGFKSDGLHHAKIVNDIGNLLKIDIFVVPKIYAFELQKCDKLYFDYFFSEIQQNHLVIFCGKKIVAKRKNDLLIPIECKNRIIFWDNIYANDYCPRKLMIGPWKYREKIKNIMINPTGLIETDLFLLDVIYLSSKDFNSKQAWHKACKISKIPNDIFIIEKYLNPYNFTAINLKTLSNNFKVIHDSLDQLLWNWNSKLSREWYPYLFCLKQDLLLVTNRISKKNIFKTQTPFLAPHITERID